MDDDDLGKEWRERVVLHIAYKRKGRRKKKGQDSRRARRHRRRDKDREGPQEAQVRR